MRSEHRARTALRITTIVLAAVAVWLLGSALARADTGVDEPWTEAMNHASYWEDRFGPGASCTKYEDHNGFIPASYEAAVAKAGTTVRVYNPAPDNDFIVGPNGQDISWVMKCDIEPTTTTSSTTTTTQPTTTTTQASTTTTGETTTVPTVESGSYGVIAVCDQVNVIVADWPDETVTAVGVDETTETFTGNGSFFVTTDGDGYTWNLGIYPDPDGPSVVVDSGEEEPCEATTTTTGPTTTTAGDPPETLPFTGFGPVGWGALALALIATGGLAVAATRR